MQWAELRKKNRPLSLSLSTLGGGGDGLIFFWRYANRGEFEKAISDLEKALELDSAHANAKKYLKEVFLANAVK